MVWLLRVYFTLDDPGICTQKMVRYIGDWYVVKVEYLQDQLADINYFEASQRYRYKFNRSKYSTICSG